MKDFTHKFKSIAFTKVHTEKGRWRYQLSFFGLVVAVSNTPLKFRSVRSMTLDDNKLINVKLRLLIERGHRCEKCGAELADSSRAEMHHLKPVALYPELVYDKGNVMLLCHDCHAAMHTSHHANTEQGWTPEA